MFMGAVFKGFKFAIKSILACISASAYANFEHVYSSRKAQDL